MLPAYVTQRLSLRPRSLDDLEDCLAMDGDATVMRHVGGPWSDADAYREHLRRRIATVWPAGLGCWSIDAGPASGRFVGWVALVPHGDDPTLVEIGWRLRRDAWGSGYATEAAAAIVHHGFAAARLPRIIADIHPDNAPSVGVASRIGFRFAGPALYGGEPCLRYIRNR